MRINDLQPGDLIFFVSPTLGIVEHTSIFLGIKNNIPYILHAAKEPYYSVMVTRLKNSDIEFNYHVVRPQNTSLALEAITILLGWVECRVPYAKESKIGDLMREAESRFSFDIRGSEAKQMEFGSELYKENYAIYPSMVTFLPYVSDDIAEVGFGCAETIVMAFNMALFMLSATYDVESKEWMMIVPKDDFIEQLDNPLPFFAPKALSAGIYEYCRCNPRHWEMLGELEPFLTPSGSPEDRNAWRTFKEELRLRSEHLVEMRRSSPFSSRFRTFSNGGSDKSLSFDLTGLIDFSVSQFSPPTKAASISRSPLSFFFSSPAHRPLSPFFVEDKVPGRSYFFEENNEPSVAECFKHVGTDF